MATRVIITLTLAVAALLMTACNQPDHTADIEAHMQMAGELHSNRLYQAAVDEYVRALAYEGIEDGKRANLNYLVARIYFEDIHNYETGGGVLLAGAGIRSRGFVHETEASKNLVASLEKIGNTVDARRQLSAAASVDAEPVSTDDVPVARIAGDPVWLSDIDDQINQLDTKAQKQLLSPEAKRQFAHQYVGAELLYRAAMREDYLSDPEIKKAQEQLTRQLLVNRYLVDKVMPKVAADSVDVMNFYAANKDSRYDGAPFDSVASQVFMDYQTQKAESAYQDYIAKLAKQEQVEFLDPQHPMKTTRHHIVMFVCLLGVLALSAGSAWAQDQDAAVADTVGSLPGIEIETSVDHAEAHIGDLITYQVAIRYDSTAYSLIPPPLGANLGAFDVKDYQPDVVSELDDDRVESRTTFVLSTFTTGDYTDPAAAGDIRTARQYAQGVVGRAGADHDQVAVGGGRGLGGYQAAQGAVRFRAGLLAILSLGRYRVGRDCSGVGTLLLAAQPAQGRGARGYAGRRGRSLSNAWRFCSMPISPARRNTRSSISS